MLEPNPDKSCKVSWLNSIISNRRISCGLKSDKSDSDWLIDSLACLGRSWNFFVRKKPHVKADLFVGLAHPCPCMLGRMMGPQYLFGERRMRAAEMKSRI